MKLACIHALLFTTLISITTAKTTIVTVDNNTGVKSMRFSLYQHNSYNKTDFMILDGIGGPGLTATTGPLGSTFILKDPLTSTTSPRSQQLGTMEMLVVTHTIQGDAGIAVNKANINMKDGPTGSISIVGVYDYRRSVEMEMPVSGGTGDFLLVQGYVAMKAVSYHGIDAVVKIDFHLYWPPYAPYNG